MKKYDWLFIIDDNCVGNSFREYCGKHKKIKSIKRLARSFVVGQLKSFRWPCYEVGRCEPKDDYFMRLAQVSWIGD